MTSSSSSDSTETRRLIRDKVVALAGKRGIDAAGLKDSDVIPNSGALDSVGVLELITWLEMSFDVTIAQPDLTVENFGTIDAIATYLDRHSS